MILMEKLNAASGVLGASTAIPLHPYVGTAYSQPTSALRIACIGINAYVSPKDWPSMSPGSFANWFANRRYRFSNGALRAATLVGHAMEQAGWPRFDGLASCWASNAIKRYLDESVGKQAHQVADADLERDAAVWHEELDILAAHDVLPEAVVVLGRPQWGPTWRVLHPNHAQPYRHLRLHAFATTPGPLSHNLNHVTVEVNGHLQSVLVIRLPHPRSARARVRAHETVAHPDFRRVLGEATRHGRRAVSHQEPGVLS